MCLQLRRWRCEKSRRKSVFGRGQSLDPGRDVDLLCTKQALRCLLFLHRHVFVDDQVDDSVLIPCATRQQFTSILHHMI